jgi:hypothetical protein
MVKGAKMPLNYDIFGNLSEPPEPPPKGRKPYKTMQELHGIKEGNDTCKTCKHCVCYTNMRGNRHYYKCELWIISSSEATDIRLKNRACNKYERESENDK